MVPFYCELEGQCHISDQVNWYSCGALWKLPINSQQLQQSISKCFVKAVKCKVQVNRSARSLHGRLNSV